MWPLFGSGTRGLVDPALSVQMGEAESQLSQEPPPAPSMEPDRLLGFLGQSLASSCAESQNEVAEMKGH